MLTDQQIDNVFKVKFRAECEKLGVDRLTFDQESDLRAWYHEQHAAKVQVVKMVEVQERNKEGYVVKKEMRLSRQQVIECRVCGEVVERNGQRGRPRKVHEGECDATWKGWSKDEREAKERVIMEVEEEDETSDDGDEDMDLAEMAESLVEEVINVF